MALVHGLYESWTLGLQHNNLFADDCCDCKKSNSLNKQVYLANNSTIDSRNCTEHMHYGPIIKNSTQTPNTEPKRVIQNILQP